MSQSRDLYCFNYTISILVLINMYLWSCMDTVNVSLLLFFFFQCLCIAFLLLFLPWGNCIDNSSVFSKSIIVKVTEELYDTRGQETFFSSLGLSECEVIFLSQFYLHTEIKHSCKNFMKDLKYNFRVSADIRVISNSENSYVNNKPMFLCNKTAHLHLSSFINVVC